MKIDILTLFPNMFDGFKTESIIKRSIDKEIVEINIIDIRDFTPYKNKQVDDYAFGGGPGMIMMCEPVFNAVESVRHIVGATNPLNADVGTIRADYAQVMEYNVIHASDCLDSAEREIAIYFNESEIVDNWKNKTEEIIENEESL